MKALTDRLQWLQHHLWSLPDGPDKTSLLDIWIECNAIAEALPEIPVFSDGVDISASIRKPPERVISLPDG